MPDITCDAITSERIARAVRRYEDQATGYVWGWQDARGEHDSSDSWAFSRCVGEIASLFKHEITCVMSSIEELFTEWRRDGRLTFRRLHRTGHHVADPVRWDTYAVTWDADGYRLIVWHTDGQGSAS